MEKEKVIVASKLFKKAAELYKKAILDEEELGTFHNKVGDLLFNKEEYSAAKSFYVNSLELVKEKKEPIEKLTKTLDGLGSLYFDKNLFAISGAFYARSLEYSEKINDTKSIAEGYERIATKFEEKDPFFADKFYLNALSRYEGLKNKEKVDGIRKKLKMEPMEKAEIPLEGIEEEAPEVVEGEAPEVVEEEAPEVFEEEAKSKIRKKRRKRKKA